MNEIESFLKLLEALSKLGIKFTVENGDTVHLQGLDAKTVQLLDAVLGARPDEHGQEEKGYRLWWD